MADQAVAADLHEAFRAYFENDNPADLRSPEEIVRQVLAHHSMADVIDWIAGGKN